MYKRCEMESVGEVDGGRPVVTMTMKFILEEVTLSRVRTPGSDFGKRLESSEPVWWLHE